MVVRSWMSPRIEQARARWTDRNRVASAGPGWPEVDSGAYNVQPAPTPLAPGSPSMKEEVRSNAKEAGNSQNEMLFMRGNRSEERRVGKSVDLGGRRIIKKKKKKE